MQIQVTGKNLDIGQSLPQKIKEELNENIHKYFPETIDAHTIVEKNKDTFSVEIKIHVNKHLTINSRGIGGDGYGAFDIALEKAAKQLRRNKRKFHENHR